MYRRAFVGFLCCVVWTGAALAQETGVNVDVSSSFESKYIWNAFDKVEGRGLDSGPVVQPSVAVGVSGSPLRVHVGGSFVVNNNSELHETVYGASLVRNATPFTTVGVGYNYYDDRVTEVGGVSVEDVDGHEVWAMVKFRNTVGVKPSVTVKYEKPSVDGVDAYTVVVGGLAYGVPVVPDVGTGVGVDVNVHTNVVYNSSVKVADVEVSGVVAWQMGVTGAVKTPAGVVVTPHVYYQVTLEDLVNDENPVWAGVGVSYSF